MTACPMDRRKTHNPNDPPDAGRVHQDGGTWHVRSLAGVRSVLRAANETKQAGFGADLVNRGARRQPVLYLDGPEHRKARQLLARYFAPRTVERRYRDFITTRADEIVEAVAREGERREVDLSEVTMRYSVEVAAQVVGLKDADMRGMSKRLMRFFSADNIASGDSEPLGPVRTARLAAVNSLRLWDFYFQDVRPAIRARRATPQEDVISYLLGEGYTDPDIVIECVTYGAAGMVTTREFIVMATWHLLEQPELRAEYLSADRTRRFEILAEILRLEPIVGHLYRRTTAPVTFEDGDETHTIPAGALVDLDIRRANIDPVAVGEAPLDLCPGRPLPPKTPDEAAAFGDGYHRCPGNHIAMEESDAFLHRLLALPIELVSTPRIQWADFISAYEVRDVRVRVRS